MVRLRRSVLALAIWTIPTLAASDPITISVHRRAAATTRVGTEVDNQVSGDDVAAVTSLTVAGDDTARAGANWKTVLSSDARSFSGSGSTVGSADSADGSIDLVFGGAETELIWHFRLDQPHLFDATGTFTTSPEQSADFGFGVASWSTSLRVPVLNDAPVFALSGRQSKAFAFHGRVPAGEYFFQVRSDSFARVESHRGATAANSALRFSLDLVPAAEPVPEPGSLALLSSGFLAILGAQRSRGRNHP